MDPSTRRPQIGESICRCSFRSRVVSETQAKTRNRGNNRGFLNLTSDPSNLAQNLKKRSQRRELSGRPANISLSGYKQTHLRQFGAESKKLKGNYQGSSVETTTL